MVRRGCCCGAYRQVWRFSGVADVRLNRWVCGALVLQLPVMDTGRVSLPDRFALGWV